MTINAKTTVHVMQIVNSNWESDEETSKHWVYDVTKITNTTTPPVLSRLSKSEVDALIEAGVTVHIS